MGAIIIKPSALVRILSPSSSSSNPPFDSSTFTPLLIVSILSFVTISAILILRRMALKKTVPYVEDLSL
jgi:hypothetical protein